ncbi:MAG: hypothetical protein IPL61_34045 [Myxococcales bacterium]|nr:hypothetical protein [Myxococcales bacterium]
MARPAFAVTTLATLVVAAASALAGCTQHADGSCLWVPGDDGTCSGRGGGGSHVDPPPPHISFAAAAVAPDRVFVIQRGDGQEALLEAPLDDGGRPAGDLTPSAIALHGTLAIWPGLAGQTLVTATSYNGGANPFVAWTEWAAVEERYRVQVARVFADGAIGARVEPIVLDPDDQNGTFQLATDGAGGVLMTRGVRRGWRLNPSRPLELEAVALHDGAVVGGPRVLAVDADTAVGCLGDVRALLTAVDGYRLLTMRRPCAWSAEPPPPVLVELRLDPAGGSAVEAASPLALAELPRTWVPGPGGFLATDDHTAWFVDDALVAARVAWTGLDGETLAAVGALARSYVLALHIRGDEARVDLRPVDGAATDQVTIAREYDLPAEGGCSTGGGAPPLVPGLALALAVAWRRRAPDASGVG